MEHLLSSAEQKINESASKFYRREYVESRNMKKKILLSVDFECSECSIAIIPLQLQTFNKVLVNFHSQCINLFVT